MERAIADSIDSIEDATPNIEDVLSDLAEDVPAADWDKLPPDLTDHLDEYLYDGKRREAAG